MRLLLDLCISPRVLKVLAAAGHDAVRVGDRAEERPDSVVLARAHAEARVLITADKDFGEILSRRAGPTVGVLRVLDLPPSRQVEAALEALGRYGEELERGALVVATRGIFRIRGPF